MTWFRRFPGLSIFIALCLLATCAMAVMIFLASARYSKISADYKEAERELQRLESAKVYPSRKNVQLIQQERDIFSNKLADLRSQLASKSPRVEPISPNGFQDKLRAAVSDVQKLAADKSVELPEGFYLGFDRYQSTLPRPEAAPILSRQLDSFQTVLERLMQAGANKITFLNREALPVEDGEKPATDALFHKQKIEIGFISSPETFRQMVNAIAQNENFLVLRTLLVRNEKQTPPSKADTAQDEEAPATASAAGDLDALFGGSSSSGGESIQSQAQRRLKFVVGQEKVEAALQIEIIRIEPPGAENKPAQPALQSAS